MMEEVTKCRYVDCVDTRAKEEKEEILHELPVCNIGLCVKWLINSGHVDLIGRDLNALRSMKFFLCSNHFTEECYLSKGTLKENAVPSPHWSATSKTFRTFQTGPNTVRLNGEDNAMVTEMDSADKQRLAESLPEPMVEADRWCRTCATKKLDLVSMTAKRKGTEMSLLSKLKLLIEIDEEDALPTKMCDECVSKLEQSFKFFQQIYVADNTLRQVFSKAETDGPSQIAAYREHWKTNGRIINEQREIAKLSDTEPRAPKAIRGGIVRRGRGRPRGRPPKTKSRPRASPQPSFVQIESPIPLELPSPTQCDSIFINNPWTPEEETVPPGDEKPGTTVFSLLADTGCSDEELDWTDVLKLMNCTNDTKPEVEEPLAESHDTNESQIDNKVESKIACPKKPLIRCEFCNDSFKLRRQLRTHLLSDHSQLSRYMCMTCLGCYESSALLSKHRALHHHDQKYICDICQQEFVEKSELRGHVKKCQIRYSCDTCGDSFPSKRVLAEHVKSHPETLPSTVQTDSDNSKLDATQESIEKPSSEPCKPMEWTESLSELDARSNESKVDCPIATSVPITTSDDVNVNTCTEDPLGVQDEVKESKLEQCPDCEEKVPSVEELGIHRMRVHSIKRKDSTCLLCGGKPFSSVEEYEQHILEHCKRLKISI